MNNFLKQNYHKHLLVGAGIGWVLTLTYSGVPLLIQLFLTGFISGVIATMWEWGWNMYNSAPIDYKDVKYSIIGALITNIIIILFL
jgi:hypothetical protein